MTWLKNKINGQITIPVLYGVIILIGAIATPVIWLESRQSENISQHSDISERIVKLETMTPMIQSDIKEIKDDLRDIKKAFDIK